ncbi:MAG: ATP-binding protein [Syntrophorhabdales bacterium]
MTGTSGSEREEKGVPPHDAGFIKKHRANLFYVTAILAVCAFLVYLETNLPFFRKFMPVLDNKLLIAILNLNFLLITLLIFIATRILLKTYIEKKRGIWGSGLKTKITVTVFSISIISSFTLFGLTTGFFYTSMDKWFNQKVEDTIENARDLSEFYYEDLFDRYEKMGRSLAQTIKEKAILDNDKKLSAFVKKEGKANFLGYLALLDMTGQPIRSYSVLDEQMNRLLIEKSRMVRKKNEARQIVPLKDGELLLFLTTVTDNLGQPRAVLFLGDRIRVKGTQSMKQISSTYREFKEARPFKKIVKYSFVIPLFLVTILSIFFSIWLGVKMATEITVPLERVKEGAAIIARGRFDISLEERGKDEIGTLVSAFNSMARELKIAKDEIEEKRKYMEVILDNVATGIISTDVRGRILLLNRAARDILKVGTDEWLGSPLRRFAGEDFRKIIRSFLRGMREDGEGVAREMTLSLHNHTLQLRASLTTLRDEAGKAEGYIVTFDDITHIMRAEKLATWREIAKRLTHEIKNPLTPIKLSAERLRRRLLPKAEGKEREVLDETTSVILSASNDITLMVNELTKFTHTTSSPRTIEDVNAIIGETVAIYRNLYPAISFTFQGAEVPRFRMDRDKMKRALINLITNSIKAIGPEPGTIGIETRHDLGKGIVWIELADTGPGIKDEDKPRVFDPYFTKNRDGVGLGLAIVNSIILELGGRIDAQDNMPRGTKMVIEIPVFEA